ncbi:MAG: DUF2339 domain-containing protein [Alphaproteobacteria bacterium]
MDGVFVLLAVLLAAGPIALIWLLFSHSKLKRDVAMLAREVMVLRSNAAPEAGEAVVPSRWVAPAQEAADPPTGPVNESASADVDTDDIAPVDLGPAEIAPKAFVFTQSRLGALGAWLHANWFVAIAALSLALAGVFLVKYGVEHGILPPTARVASAFALGLILIAAGEWARRCGGDSIGYLPSTFSGAGLAAIFVAVFAARQLYGLIGVETAFAGFVLTAGLSILLGWTHGPFLSAIGLIGATVAPFATGGGAAPPPWLMLYFGGVAAIGLIVDAVRRSAWISALALTLTTLAAAALVFLDGDLRTPLLGFAMTAFFASILAPTLTLAPALTGPMTFGSAHQQGPRGWPEFPTRLAAAGVGILAAAVLIASGGGAMEFWIAIAAGLAGLCAIVLWSRRSPALADLTLVLGMSVLTAVALQGAWALGVFTELHKPVLDSFEPRSRALSILIGVGLAVSALLAWRSNQEKPLAAAWAVAAGLFAPAMFGVLTFLWKPLDVLAPSTWALHGAAVAALFTLLAGQAYRLDGASRMRTALYALAAMACIAYAASLVLTKTPLTLSLAALALGAAWLDRQFDIRPLAWITQAGVMITGYRLLGDPGVLWAIEAPLRAVIEGYLGASVILVAAWVVLQRRARVNGQTIIESAVAVYLGAFVCVLLYRWLNTTGDLFTHWALSLFGGVWLMSAAGQFYRRDAGGLLAPIRPALGGVFATVGLTLFAASATMANPLWFDIVLGRAVLNSLFLAYLAPGVGLVAAARWGERLGLPALIRRLAGAGGVLLLALFAFLEIRRAWQGVDIRVQAGVMDGELYSYTVALLLLGGVLLAIALKRKSNSVRRAALGVIGIAIAKVFLIDMSGLEGLIRVFSFLALGLSLAGLAWLDRYARRAADDPPAP